MVSNPKIDPEPSELNERLKSLRIDRSPAALPPVSNRAPKKLLLLVAIIVALGAVGFWYLSSSAKAVSVADVTVETGRASAGSTVLSVSGYVVAHHKIAVGAKVMGRVNWIGVEKGDTVKEGQILVRLENTDFQAQVNQAKAQLAAAQA